MKCPLPKNTGGLYRNLKELRDTEGRSSCNLFRSLGLDSVMWEGNDIPSLVAAFAKVKDTSRPTVVHIHTQKGKGYAPAEADREEFHWEMPFDLETGKPKVDCSGMEDYHSLTGKFLLEVKKEDHTVVAISSGTPTVIGFTPERRKQAGRQFVDVGIAEEHAVALASGIAAGGGRPVYGVYSTFIQRCYDQLSQDLCINGNTAVITVFMGTVAGMNDVTHRVSSIFRLSAISRIWFIWLLRVPKSILLCWNGLSARRNIPLPSVCREWQWCIVRKSLTRIIAS